MKRYTQPRFSDQLPAAPCTNEMKEEVIRIARSENISVAEIIRRATSLFLSEKYSKSIAINSNAISEVV